MKRIGIFGGSFNPPGIHHRLIAESVLSLNYVDQLMVIPCGQRKDKLFVEGSDRSCMVGLAFANLPGCIVNSFNIDLDVFTSNFKYELLFRSLGEIWHIVGSDQVANARDNMSIIQTRWEKGEWVFENLKFIVVERPDFPVIRADLPRHSLVLSLLINGSSTQIREDLLTGRKDGVSREVLSYIYQKGLYGSAT